MLMMERYISIFRNLLAKSILTIDYSNPPSPSELPLLPPCEPEPLGCEPEPPPEGVCEPEPESLPLPPVCEPPEVDPALPLPSAGAEAEEAALLGLRKTVLVPP